MDLAVAPADIGNLYSMPSPYLLNENADQSQVEVVETVGSGSTLQEVRVAYSNESIDCNGLMGDTDPRITAIREDFKIIDNNLLKTV